MSVSPGPNTRTVDGHVGGFGSAPVVAVMVATNECSATTVSEQCDKGMIANDRSLTAQLCQLSNRVVTLGATARSRLRRAWEAQERACPWPRKAQHVSWKQVAVASVWRHSNTPAQCFRFQFAPFCTCSCKHSSSNLLTNSAVEGAGTSCTPVCSCMLNDRPYNCSAYSASHAVCPCVPVCVYVSV
jgi:hypothetical protein